MRWIIILNPLYHAVLVTYFELAVPVALRRGPKLVFEIFNLINCARLLVFLDNAKRIQDAHEALMR